MGGGFKQRLLALKRETHALYLAARHPGTPWYAKLFVAGIVAYALSPIDLIPDFIPILGYLDDLVLIPLGIVVAVKLVPPDVLAECRARAAEAAVDGKPVSRVAAAVIVIIWIAMAVAVAFALGIAPAHAQDRAAVLKAVAADIEKLKADYPQLRDFSVATNFRAEPLGIYYAFRTHAPSRTGGWTSGVPNPDADGVWFDIDLHDPGSTLQKHTQPMTTARLCLGESRVSFLMLEGRETRSLYGPIWNALAKQGARECAR